MHLLTRRSAEKPDEYLLRDVLGKIAVVKYPHGNGVYGYSEPVPQLLAGALVPCAHQGEQACHFFICHLVITSLSSTMTT